MKKRIVTFFALALCCFITNILAMQSSPSLLSRLDVQQFIQEMVIKHHLNHFELLKLFSKVHVNDQVITHINHPFEKKTWVEYRDHFVTQDRIQDGVAFWKKYRAELNKAYKNFGVPRRIIVAIIGIETKYGQNLGTFKVINTLSTLAFSDSPRSEFFKRELEAFLVLCDQNNLHPFHIYGSYAGAIGLPQFMPSSAMNYATSLAHHAQLDIIHNPKDAIDSVANYLHAMGWKKDAPIAIPTAPFSYKKAKKITDSSDWNTLSASKIRKLGMIVPRKFNKEAMGIVKLPIGPHRDRYWLGFNNLYVITKYNNSIQYAMAAFELSHAIETAYLKGKRS